ncbi:hypothetical protein Taro_040285 [Colocasia esculenta]|uniref:Uncharacterized protein n=1 Tax=Colocasia esculenta TaxID=4460 RepID=A0A843WCT3_COLES|nr:hypothetical protein [Colocasia esculenta]
MASIEALAMAGADYVECGIDLDSDAGAPPPPHLLLLDEQPQPAVAGKGLSPSDGKWPLGEEETKKRLVAWAKAVATLQEYSLLTQSKYKI